MRRRVKGNVAGSREQDFGSPESPESPASPVAKLNRSVSFFDDELPPSILPPSGKRSPPVHRPHHRPVQAAHDPDEHFAVAKRQRPPNIQTDFRSPLPIESPYDSMLGSPMAIQSPLGGSRHPSIPQLSPDSQSPLATTHSRSLARPSTIPQSPGTPLQLRNRKKTVVIDDPKALPGAAWFTLFFVACHFLGFLFIWMAGYYYNTNPAPTSLFLIPTFTTGCVTGLGMLCLVTQRNRYIRILMAPRTGILLAVGGLAGGSVWCLLIYGPRQNEFSQAIELAGFSAMCLLYFILVRRRFSFANVAFAAGGHAVARVRSIMVRALFHALVLGVYIGVWSMLYIQLVDLGPLPNNTVPANATEAEKEESSVKNIASVAIPKWVKKGAQNFSDEFLRYMGRIYMAYNLYVVSQMVKASMQISTSGAAYSVMLAARYSMPVKLRSNTQLNNRLKSQLPSVFIAGHFLMVSSCIRCLLEALRRFSTKRMGILHNLASLGITALHPILESLNSHGVCYMEMTGENMMKSSKAAWSLYKRTGMDCVINDDVLFGARISSYILVASAASIAGSLLVEIFGFPMTTTVQIGHMCFVTACAAGNWGMEAAEAWLVTLYLEFAGYPETIYISNPDLANNIHSVLFGCDKRIGIQKARSFDKKTGWFSNSPLPSLGKWLMGSPRTGSPESPQNPEEEIDMDENTVHKIEPVIVELDETKEAEERLEEVKSKQPPRTFLEMQKERKMKRIALKKADQGPRQEKAENVVEEVGDEPEPALNRFKKHSSASKPKLNEVRDNDRALPALRSGESAEVLTSNIGERGQEQTDRSTDLEDVQNSVEPESVQGDASERAEGEPGGPGDGGSVLEDVYTPGNSRWKDWETSPGHVA